MQRCAVRVFGTNCVVRAALNPIECQVIPAYGDPNGSHVTIKVVSAAFEGKRAVQRQQMVYKVCFSILGKRMQTDSSWF
jgi:stress-induced morphogen